MKQLICAFLFFMMSILQASQVIMIIGPSCAGKSTLAHFLCKKLIENNKEWIVIDFDEVAEDNEQLIILTNQAIEKNINVIIDTNSYEVGMEKRFNEATNIIKIIVTAPLNILLQRDEKRTKQLRRHKQRAFWCRHFVIESFNRSLAWPYDLIVDSSEKSVQESVEFILSQISKKSFMLIS